MKQEKFVQKYYMLELSVLQLLRCSFQPLRLVSVGLLLGHLRLIQIMKELNESRLVQ